MKNFILLSIIFLSGMTYGQDPVIEKAYITFITQTNDKAAATNVGILLHRKTTIKNVREELAVVDDVTMGAAFTGGDTKKLNIPISAPYLKLSQWMRSVITISINAADKWDFKFYITFEDASGKKYFTEKKDGLLEQKNSSKDYSLE
jgi:ABC-type transporter Mla maintaining outer membrane lipid asymmetry ATPase subunit MlaF